MECRDVREMADSFLAEELLTETNHDILRHLDTCAACRAEFAGRKALRDGLRRAVQTSGDLAPRREFLNGMTTTLQQAALRSSAGRRFAMPRWWAIAATILLAATAGTIYLGRGSSFTDALVRDAVGDHRNCALHFRLSERPISLADAARSYGAWYEVLDRLPAQEVAAAGGPVRVLERHACVYMGRRFAHVVLEYRRQRVSLLVTAVDGRFAGDAAPHLVSTGAGDTSLMSFQAGSRVVFVVGDISQSDLSVVTDAIAPSLSRELSRL